MRAITLLLILLLVTAATGCSNSGPPSPTEPQKLGAHRIPSRSSAPARPAPAAQP